MADGNMALLHPVGRAGMRHNNLNICFAFHGTALTTKQGESVHCAGPGSIKSVQYALAVAACADAHKEVAAVAISLNKAGKNGVVAKVVCSCSKGHAVA